MEPKFVVELERIDYFDERVYAVHLSNNESRRLVSSTTYLDIAPKPYLIPFYKKNTPEEIERRFREGQIRGSRLHWAFYVLGRRGAVIYQPAAWKNPPAKLLDKNRLIIQQCKNEDRMYCYIEDQDEMLAVLRVREWFRKVRPVVHYSELIVWSLRQNVAGTLDLICEIEAGKYAVSGSKPVEIEGGWWLGDYKTGNVDKILNFAQLSSYLKCVEEDLPEVFAKIKGCFILNPNADTTSGDIPGMQMFVRSKEQVLAEDWPYFRHIQAVWHRHHPNFEAKVFDFETVAVLDDELLADVQTGEAQNEQLTQALVDSINTETEKQKPEPTKKTEKKSTPAGATKKTETDLSSEQDWEKVDAKAKKIVDLITGVYAKSDEQEKAKGISIFLQRSVLIDGKAQVTTVKDFYALLRKLPDAQANDILDKALVQVKADVKQLTESLGGGEKK